MSNHMTVNIPYRMLNRFYHVQIRLNKFFEQMFRVYYFTGQQKSQLAYFKYPKVHEF